MTDRYIVNDILEWVGKEVNSAQVEAVLWGIMIGHKEAEVSRVVKDMRKAYIAERERIK
jgi:hypothetical protein